MEGFGIPLSLTLEEGLAKPNSHWSDSLLLDMAVPMLTIHITSGLYPHYILSFKTSSAPQSSPSDPVLIWGNNTDMNQITPHSKFKSMDSGPVCRCIWR